MELSELTYKYRQSAVIRFLCTLVIAVIPAVNYWLSEGEILEDKKNNFINELAAARSKLDSLLSQVAQIPSLEAKVAAAHDEILKAQEILPNKLEIDNVLATLGSLESDYSVTITKFTPGQEVQPAPHLEYKEMPIDLELRGEFMATMRFLDRLVHMPYLTHVRNIQLMAPTEDKKEKVVSQVINSKAKLILFRAM